MATPETGPTVLDLHAYLGEFDPFALKPLADRWEAAGVGWMIGVGDDVPTSEAAVDAAWSLPNTIAGVGLHPTKIPAHSGSAADLEELAALEELATDPQVAVISDLGVDDAADAPRDLQEDVFRSVIDIAVANSRSLLLDWQAPVAQLLELWDGLPPGQRPRAALLTFAGTAAEAEELLERNFYFSVSPEAVGIPGRAATAAEVLTTVPADRLFVHSSARAGNGDAALGPAVVRDVLERLAAERRVDPRDLATEINDNLWEFLTWRPK
jgi:TatD DNase family protein